MRAAEIIYTATDKDDLAVIDTKTGRRTGGVGDIIIDPAHGKVLGLLARNYDLDKFVPARAGATPGSSAMVMRDHSLAPAAKFPNPDALALGEMIGASVITDAGKLLGTIAETQFDARAQKIFYRVKQTGVKKFFTEALLLPGDASRGYSRLGHRLIVTDGVEEEQPADAAMSSFAAAVKRNLHAALERYGLAVWFAMTLFLLGAMLWV